MMPRFLRPLGPSDSRAWTVSGAWPGSTSCSWCCLASPWRYHQLTHAPILIVGYELIVASHVQQGVPAFLVTVALVLPLTIVFARVVAAVLEIPSQQHRSLASVAVLRHARAEGVPV
jgi:hypothetical protein